MVAGEAGKGRSREYREYYIQLWHGMLWAGWGKAYKGTRGRTYRRTVGIRHSTNRMEPGRMLKGYYTGRQNQPAPGIYVIYIVNNTIRQCCRPAEA